MPGLSSSRGEVSAFMECRLAFWGEEDESTNNKSGEWEDRKPSSLSSSQESSLSGRPPKSGEGTTFLPSMPAPAAAVASNSAKQSPLTPFDHGCLASMSPAKSPYFPAFAQQSYSDTPKAGCKKEGFQPPALSETFPLSDDLKKPHQLPLSPSPPAPPGPPPPSHHGKQTYRSTVIHNDNNPLWENDASNNTFHIPLQKSDLYPTLHSDGCRLALEVQLQEEMAATENFMVGGVLSHAVGAAAAATSLVPVVGKSLGEHGERGARVGMEKMGLGTDRTLGGGYIDLMPLLMGNWDEEFDKENRDWNNTIEEDRNVDNWGRMNAKSYWIKRRCERSGLLDVWVPLYRENEGPQEHHGKVHLIVSYEPNGMVPKQHDVVALESFARRPHSDSNIGSVITPVLPPLHPLMVVETRHPYLLVEYTTSRTVTSVSRSGHVKSSKWERTHRVRIHRNSAFVIERRTLIDAVGDVARFPGDIVLSTPVGRELSEVTAPVVAAAGEVVAPMFIWGKLLLATGTTGVKAALAGVSVASSIAAKAVVDGSRDKVRREGYEGRVDEEGVYRYG